MASEDVAQLIERLLELTSERKIDWSSTGDRHAYMFALASGSVIVDTVDGDGQAPFRLRVFNSEGVAIETERTGFESGPSEPVGRLWDRARRSALQLDETIHGMLRELSDDL